MSEQTSGPGEPAREKHCQTCSCGRAVVTAPDERLWDVGDVAKYLNRSKSFVYKASKAGAIPVARIHGHLDASRPRLSFRPADVRALASPTLQRELDAAPDVGATGGALR